MFETLAREGERGVGRRVCVGRRLYYIRAVIRTLGGAGLGASFWTYSATALTPDGVWNAGTHRECLPSIMHAYMRRVMVMTLLSSAFGNEEAAGVWAMAASAAAARATAVRTNNRTISGPCSIEPGFNIAGNDMRRQCSRPGNQPFEPCLADSTHKCMQRCGRRPSCAAFTFSVSSHLCWLKSSRAIT